MNQERKVLKRQTLACGEPKQISAFFRQWGEFEAVVRATASYEWLWQLLEPLARRLVLAHPKKLRVIAESKNKSDKLEAQVSYDAERDRHFLFVVWRSRSRAAVTSAL